MVAAANEAFHVYGHQWVDENATKFYHDRERPGTGEEWYNHVMNTTHYDWTRPRKLVKN